MSVVATNLAYPLGDVLLLSAVFGVFSLTGWRPGHRWQLIGIGILASTAADAVFLFQSANGTYVEGTWVDVLWPAAMLLIALAAWTPDRTREGLDVEGRPLLAVPVVCALVATGVLAYDHFRTVNLLAIALATLTLLLVIARLVVTFRENSAALRAHAPRGHDRCAHGARQPPKAHRRPRAAARRGGRAEDPPHAVRPERLQGLQRHVRTSRR